MTAGHATGGSSIDVWLQIVRTRVEERAPQLLALFDTYAGEARFGRGFIESDLSRLEGGARVLEIGAGALLLSCQLCREGIDVTALEPVGQGFSHFGQMQDIVAECAQIESCLPQLIRRPAEDLEVQRAFDYAFSINVMEHVADWEAVFRRVMVSLKPGARYRFTCPNYLFPYEPHFNIPTLFSKRLTWTVLHSHIVQSPNMPDPEGTWRSLNWISVPAVAAAVRRMPAVQISFDRRQLVSTLVRAVEDPQFASRRSGWVRVVVRIAVRLGLHHLAAFIPVAIQPIMDCTMTVVGAPDCARTD